MFSPPAGSMHPGTLPNCSRSGPVARDGLSLFRGGCPLSEPPPRSQRSWPTTSLPSRARLLPVRTHAPQPLSGLRQTRLLQRMNPVAAPAHGTNSCFAGQPPLRDCYLPRDRKQNRPGLYSARLPNPPDSPSLPAAALFPGAASDHRSRFATFPVARCSSNLLEPSSL